MSKIFAQFKTNPYLCSVKRKNKQASLKMKPEDRHKLPCGVMVARRILVPPVRVRILPRQRKERAKSLRFSSFFIFASPQNVKVGRLDILGDEMSNLPKS